MAFTRTPTGNVARYRFYDHPIVWVEGPSDVHFYDPALDNVRCRIEPMHGKDNAAALIDGLLEKDYPYVVVVDGDYEILRKRRSRHRRLLVLRRYSFENYLWEKPILERACRNAARCVSDQDVLEGRFEKALSSVSKNLYDLVALDIALRRNGKKRKLIPDSPDSLLAGQHAHVFNVSRIHQRCMDAKKELSEDMIVEAKGMLDKFLEENRLVDVLKGHFAFGLLRKLFVKTVRQKRGRAPHMDNDALVQLMATLAWTIVPTPEHRRLRQKLKRSVREAQRGVAP